MHLRVGNPLEKFHEHFAAQLNDTHPAIAVAELMRLLVDEHLMDWDTAWDITTQTLSYTNHTLLSEALEQWSLPLFGALLPRHLEIIFEINRRFLDDVRAKYPNDDARAARMSLINEHGEKWVRMAHLATVGSHAVNGVAALHTELLKKGVLKDFYDLYPERFHNVTNGVTPRRWMVECNPDLTRLITEAIGDAWIRDTEGQLPRLEPFADDPAFRESWRKMRRANKVALANDIHRRVGLRVDPDSLFDVQIKRLHEYKRQHLNALHMLTRYLDLLDAPDDGRCRTVIVSGKAAPGYAAAKLIIKLITSIGEVVNTDSRLRDRLKVVFLPDFNVKNASRIYPGADLSEQISMASTEASGTGNMKFAMNGALTIGTLDGANVEIRDAVGPENFFLFGLTTDQVRATKAGRVFTAGDCRVERAPAPGARFHRLGPSVARRRPPVSADARCAAGPRRVSALRRLRLVRGLPERSRRGVRGSRHLDAEIDSHRRAHGPLLVGSRDRRVLPPDLGRVADRQPGARPVVDRAARCAKSFADG